MNKHPWFLRLTLALLLMALVLPAGAMAEEIDPFGYYEEPVSITSVLAYAPPHRPRPAQRHLP